MKNWHRCTKPDENNGYKAMKLYISKLNPKSNAFSQYLKKQWNYDDEVLYDARLIGINKLDNTMKSISEAAKLLKMHINCSVGATVITLWSNAGIQNCHILAMSGRCSEQTLVHYNTWPSTSWLQHCSEVLSRSLTGKSSYSSGTINNTCTQIQKKIEMSVATTSWLTLQQLQLRELTWL